MRSKCGRFVLTFNGEIYNYQELRDELEQRGYEFKGTSDTEVLAEGFSCWGIGPTVLKAVGMFAIGIWDNVREELSLIRDRMGEKPLYYGFVGMDLVFASELKAFRAHPEWRGIVDDAALKLYFTYGYIPHPYAIFQNVFQLTPGAILTAGRRHIEQKELPVAERYWKLEEEYRQGMEHSIDGSEEEILAGLEAIMERSVRSQMVADVPIGAMLSGGIDSSVVVALMQRCSKTPVKTFTIGFSSSEESEAAKARRVATALGTEHTEQIISASDAIDEVARMAGIFDEPFADSSQIPTYIVSKLARQKVKVCLSGDAGDELLLGYPSYARAQHAYRALRWIPRSIRIALSESLQKVPESIWRLLADSEMLGLGSEGIDRVRKGLKVFGFSNYADLHVTAAQSFVGGFVHDTVGVETPVDLLVQNQGRDARGQISYLGLCDLVSYLSSDILTKVDRSAMAVSLETRVPLLDHRFVRYTFGLRDRWKLQNGSGKYILRKLYKRLLPSEALPQRKQGFGLPLEEWIRGPMRPWAEELLSEKALSQHEYINSAAARNLWKEHIGGTRRWHFPIWQLLMFQAWYGAQGSSCIDTRHPF